MFVVAAATDDDNDDVNIHVYDLTFVGRFYPIFYFNSTSNRRNCLLLTTTRYE